MSINFVFGTILKVFQNVFNSNWESARNASKSNVSPRVSDGLHFPRDDGDDDVLMMKMMKYLPRCRTGKLLESL